MKKFSSGVALVPVEVTSDDSGSPTSPAIEIDLPCGTRVRCHADANTELVADILACEEASVKVTLPKRQTANNKNRGRVVKTDFQYEPNEDVHICPAGEQLKYYFTNQEKGLTLRRYWTNVFGKCAIKDQCTTGPQRRIARWQHEHVLEDVQGRLDENAPACARAERQLSIRSSRSKRAWRRPLLLRGAPSSEPRARGRHWTNAARSGQSAPVPSRPDEVPHQAIELHGHVRAWDPRVGQCRPGEAVERAHHDRRGAREAARVPPVVLAIDAPASRVVRRARAGACHRRDRAPVEDVRRAAEPVDMIEEAHEIRCAGDPAAVGIHPRHVHPVGTAVFLRVVEHLATGAVSKAIAADLHGAHTGPSQDVLLHESLVRHAGSLLDDAS